MDVQLGDIVTREPVSLLKHAETSMNLYQGKVVYIHPEKRFHAVEFQLPGGTIIECYQGIER